MSIIELFETTQEENLCYHFHSVKITIFTIFKTNNTIQKGVMELYNIQLTRSKTSETTTEAYFSL